MKQFCEKRAMVRVTKKAGDALVVILRNGTGVDYMEMCAAAMAETLKCVSKDAKLNGGTRKGAGKFADHLLAIVKRKLDLCVDEVFGDAD